MFSDVPQLAVCINPYSGGYKRRPTQDLVALAEHNGHRVFHTLSFDHLKACIEESYATGLRHFIFAGGDGTWNRALNSFFQLRISFEDVILGLLPVGTGNDWAQMYGLSTDASHVVRAAEQQKEIRIPLGEVFLESTQEPSVFANIVGTGFDAMVARQVERSNKRNKLIYLRKVITNLPKYKAQSMSWTVDGQKYQENVFSLHAGIGQSSGGGLRIMPDTPLFPQMLSVTEVLKASTWEYGKALPKLIKGRISDLPFIRMRTAHEITIDSHDLQSGVEADGEWLGPLPCTIRLSPHHFRCIDTRVEATF